MRVGIIRGDLPGAVFLGDLEAVSRYNPPTEPRGQERYINRPTVAKVEAVLADPVVGAGAVIQGSDIVGSLPITIDGTNDTLRLKTSAAASFTVMVIGHAVYTTLAALLAAINVALGHSGIVAFQGTGSGSRVALEGPHGAASYIELDTVGHGSTANTILGLTNGIRTMVPATTIITSCNPILGTLDVSTATLNGLGATTAALALSLIPAARGTDTAIADVIAPRFAETTVAVDSFLIGDMSELLNANFNPDTRRFPALTPGPAISVVQDDGVTPFVASLPVITSAVLAAGHVTIGGTGLGDYTRDETVVKFTGAITVKLEQKAIVHAGGSVSPTSILVPASLIPGATVTTTSVRVQVRQRVSAAPGFVVTL
jgi:hypothetical protein